MMELIDAMKMTFPVFGLCLAVATIVGFWIKSVNWLWRIFLPRILRLFALPTYIAILVIELTLGNSDRNRRSLLRLNLPDSNKDAIAMDIFAAIATVFWLPPQLISLASEFYKDPAFFLFSHFVNTLYSPSDFMIYGSLLAAAAIGFVLFFSFRVPLDSRDGIEKIKSLQIPRLFFTPYSSTN